MPFNPFKDAATKANEEFTRAYQKGVNLGPQSWGEAVNEFSNASKHYAEASDLQKSKVAHALATLFYALLTRDAASWQNCSLAMKEIGDTNLNVGFTASSAEIARQAQIMSEDRAATSDLTGNSNDVSRVEALKSLAQRYLELIGSDLIIWKLLKQELDPQKQAYYLLGLASLIEANSVMGRDPSKSVSLLSESATYFELAGIDPLNLRGNAEAKRDAASKVAKCWLCSREVQGKNSHYLTLPIYVSAYFQQKYGPETPSSIEGDSVITCMSCYGSIRYVADMIARDYHEKAMREISAVAARLEARITSLERQIGTLRSRVNR